MKSVLLISHGSHSPKLEPEIQKMTAVLKQKSGIPIFEYAFLEINQPDIAQGIINCINKGAKEVTVLLNFLNSGRHVNDDIPKIVHETNKKYPHVKIHITQPVGQHPKIDELFLDLLK
jgi:sirohydrochlorin ferrochelatase